MGLFSRGWVGIFTALIVATVLCFLGWLSWSGWRSWRYHRKLATLPPMERLYQQMLTLLGRQGFHKRSAETPLEYARQQKDHQVAERARAIEEISQAYVNWRYGNEAPDLTRLKERLQELKKKPLRHT